MSSKETIETAESICENCGGQQQYYMPYMPAMRNPYFPTGLPLGPQTSPMPFSPEQMQQPTTFEGQDMGAQPGMGTQPVPPFITNPLPGAGIPSLPPSVTNPVGGTLTTPPLFSGEAPAQTVYDINYTAGYLRTQIGKIVVVSFLLGTNTFTDQSGRLIAVGASYIVLQDIVSGTYTMCDLYSIKFVRTYR